MTLRPLSDVSPADWFVSSGADPWNKVCLGPPGFEAYARVFYDLDEDSPEGSAERLRADVRVILARHTSTPETCYFALWDGWRQLEGGRQDTGYRSVTFPGASPEEIAEAREFTARAKSLDCAPAFPSAFLRGPKVSVPHRDFYLFEGPLTADFDWGAADFAPDLPRHIPNEPALIWPYDHEWFLAADVDPDWFGIGGSQALVDELLSDQRLDAEPTAYDASDWETR